MAARLALTAFAPAVDSFSRPLPHRRVTRPRWWTGIAVDTLVSVTRPDGSALDLAPSLAVRNHSPTVPFSSMPPGTPAVALDHYQEFKTDHVAGWLGADGW